MSEDKYRELLYVGLEAFVHDVPGGPDWEDLESHSMTSSTPPHRPPLGRTLAITTAALVLALFGGIALFLDDLASPSPNTRVTTPPDSKPTTSMQAIDSFGQWRRVLGSELALGGSGDQVPTGIAASPSGFVAVGESGKSEGNDDDEAVVWTSATGDVWDRVAMAEAFVDSAMTDVIWFPDEQAFVAVGHHSSEGAVWLSTDGQAWDRVALIQPQSEVGGIEVDAVALGGPGLVAVGREWLSEGTSISAVWLSEDGRRWVRTGRMTDSGEQSALWDIVEYGSSLFSIGYVDETVPAVWMSPDGSDWTLAASTSQFAGVEVLTSIAANQDLLVVTTSSDADEGAAIVWLSEDGLRWQEARPEERSVQAPSLQSVSVAPFGWVAVGWDAATYQQTAGVIWSSLDGFTWHRYESDSESLGSESAGIAMTSVAFYGDVGVASGITGGNCIERFAGCDLDAVMWIWSPGSG